MYVYTGDTRESIGCVEEIHRRGKIPCGCARTFNVVFLILLRKNGCFLLFSWKSKSLRILLDESCSASGILSFFFFFLSFSSSPNLERVNLLRHQISRDARDQMSRGPRVKVSRGVSSIFVRRAAWSFFEDKRLSALFCTKRC